MDRKSLALTFVIATCLLVGCRSTTPLQTHSVAKLSNPTFAGETAFAPRTGLFELSNRGQFDEIISSSPNTVLVDFYADWCKPCGKQSQVLNDVAANGDPNATIVKVNVDQHPELVNQFQVDGLPTLVLFKNGGVVTRKTGFADHREIAAMLAH